jgi:exonuclease III
MSCCLLNCCSLRRKFGLFRNFVNTRSSSIYFLTETWLSADIENSCFGLPEFRIFRRDRNTDAHGGVAILVKNSLKVREVDLHSIEYEITAVDLCGTSGLCRLVCAYRQPDMSIEDTVSFLQQILTLTDACKSVVICGDFNIPKMCWKPLTGREVFSNALLNFNVRRWFYTVCSRNHTSGWEHFGPGLWL